MTGWRRSFGSSRGIRQPIGICLVITAVESSGGGVPEDLGELVPPSILTYLTCSILTCKIRRESNENGGRRCAPTLDASSLPQQHPFAIGRLVLTYLTCSILTSRILWESNENGGGDTAPKLCRLIAGALASSPDWARTIVRRRGTCEGAAGGDRTGLTSSNSGDSERRSGLFSMMGDHLPPPSETEVPGGPVMIGRLDLTAADEAIAVCRRDRAATADRHPRPPAAQPTTQFRRHSSRSRADIAAGDRRVCSASRQGSAGLPRLTSRGRASGRG